MTAAEIEQEVRRISRQLEDLDDDTPEMTGMDWASEHGWISQEEWESAGAKAERGVELQNAEVAKIEALRNEHPQAMDEFLGAHIARLKRARDQLTALEQQARTQGAGFAMSFNLSLLPDIISCLKSWRGRSKPKYWPAWMWRVAFRIVEESEAFISRENA